MPEPSEAKPAPSKGGRTEADADPSKLPSMSCQLLRVVNLDLAPDL
jgi:hypothetical protein